MAEISQRLVPLRADGHSPPLVCAHPVSGSAYAYLGLSNLLDGDRPVYGIEASGYDDHRLPIRSLTQMSQLYASVVAQAWPNRPVTLLGWSMGGVIAFDMARRLADVATVIMVDSWLPDPALRPPREELVRRFITDLLASSGIESQGWSRLQDVVSVGVLPPEIDIPFLQRRFAVYTAHIDALFGYAPVGSYDGRVVLIEAAGSAPKYERWQAVAPKMECHQVPGDHYSMWRDENLARLAETIEKSLADVFDRC